MIFEPAMHDSACSALSSAWGRLNKTVFLILIDLAFAALIAVSQAFIQRVRKPHCAESIIWHGEKAHG